MKKYLFVLLGLLTLLSVAACATSDEDIDLTQLSYYSYLSDDNPIVTITVKGKGTMKLQLFPDLAKNTVDNFLYYVQEKSYSGSSFHRVIEDFMIQGGKVSETGCTIKGEFSSNGVINNLSHDRGVISMARTLIKNSATSQFFIMHKLSPHLNGDYAGFGGLVSGFNVLDLIATTPVSRDVPVDEIIIKSISVSLNGYLVGDPICSN